MSSKIVYESLENILKPKSEGEIEKSLMEYLRNKNCGPEIFPILKTLVFEKKYKFPEINHWNYKIGQYTFQNKPIIEETTIHIKLNNSKILDKIDHISEAPYFDTMIHIMKHPKEEWSVDISLSLEGIWSMIDSKGNIIHSDVDDDFPYFEDNYAFAKSSQELFKVIMKKIEIAEKFAMVMIDNLINYYDRY